MPDAKIHFLVEENRNHNIMDIGLNKIISFPTGISKIIKLLKLRKYHYQLGIMQFKTFSDINITNRLVRYENNQFYEIKRGNIFNELIKIMFSTILGEFLSILFILWYLYKRPISKTTESLPL